MQLFLKILSGMANSVDPDQAAPSGTAWSGSALFACVISSAALVHEVLVNLSYSQKPELGMSYKSSLTLQIGSCSDLYY